MKMHDGRKKPWGWDYLPHNHRKFMRDNVSQGLDEDIHFNLNQSTDKRFESNYVD